MTDAPIEKGRKRGRRKPGSASSVTLAHDVADLLDRLVERYRETSKWDVDRQMVVARLIREAEVQVPQTMPSGNFRPMEAKP